VVWSHAANIHGDLDVGADGCICFLSQEIDRDVRGAGAIPGLFVTDYVVLLSPLGKELRKISVLNAFRDSPFSVFLDQIEGTTAEASSAPETPPDEVDSGGTKRNLLQTSSVKVLNPAQTAKFPAFKAGQLLIAIRELDTVAILDPVSAKIAWAARGAWQAPGDAEFLDNGNLLVFDTMGLATKWRVIEYNVQTQALPWSYSEETATSPSHGGIAQRLANGNTFVFDARGGKILQVTPDKELVWLGVSAHSREGPYLSAVRMCDPAATVFLEAARR
jgi:hypothetical protein